ncbi:MAG: KH domain-containing protein [Peptococcaceae bacterium]|nr:KH domain-containing protein [Peptococcaceae bacterium]
MIIMSGKEYTAKSIEEALEKALNEMMLTRDDIEYEVLVQPSKGLLGFGKRDAVVRVKKKVIEELKTIVADIKEERKAVVQEVVKEQPVAAEAKEEPVVHEEPVVEAIAEKVMEPAEEVPEENSAESVQAEDTYVEEKEESAPAQKSVEKADKKEAFANAEVKGKEFLGQIFKEMKLDVTIDVKEKNGYLVFDLKGKNLGILIGRRGDTLDSLQFLLNLVINEKNGAKVKGIIDIENYRAKREETLIGLSHKLAAKARKTGQKVVLEPMNPQERRIIHMALQNDRRVSTYSEGEEPYRKVVIVPEVKENNGRKDYTNKQA